MSGDTYDWFAAQEVKPEQRALRSGDRVIHERFGGGVVVIADDPAELFVEFDSGANGFAHCSALRLEVQR